MAEPGVQAAAVGTVPPRPVPTDHQLRWLERGLEQPGGKLPLFERDGRKVPARTVRSCLDAGWAEPWFANPLKPDWLVCRLTDAGRALLAERLGIPVPQA
ncbi:MAG TPA: hypothetical protein VEB20_19520 [Azospirillaceae bacterium]|nr:hypothetical protein [Azospirillaceae bacterium]